MITKKERKEWREELKFTNPFWAETRAWIALNTIDDMEAEIMEDAVLLGKASQKIEEQAKEIDRLTAMLSLKRNPLRDKNCTKAE